MSSGQSTPDNKTGGDHPGPSAAFSSPSDDSDMDVFDGVGNPSQTNVSKEEKNLSRGQKELKSTLTNLFSIAKQNSAAYMSDTMAPVRDFFAYAVTRPREYPIGQDASSSAAFTPPPDEPTLTHGFVSTLSAEFSDGSHRDPPSLKVIEKTTKHRKEDFRSEFNYSASVFPVTTLTAIDGDTKPITIKCASQLNAYVGSISVGSVIRLQSYQAVYFAMSELGSRRVALILCSFTSLGTYNVTDEEKGAYADRVEVTVGRGSSEGAQLTKGENTESSCDHFASLPLNVECSDSNRLCNMHGVFFEGTCICDAIPVEGWALEDIAEQAWFVDRPVSEMTDRHKRCLLYWWYATNVYYICGKNKRMVLPDCLVSRIRSLVPSPTGEYVGNKKSKIKKKKKKSTGGKRKRRS